MQNPRFSLRHARVQPWCLYGGICRSRIQGKRQCKFLKHVTLHFPIWKSYSILEVKKQENIVLSTTEARSVSFSLTTQEVAWLRELLAELAYLLNVSVYGCCWCELAYLLNVGVWLHRISQTNKGKRRPESKPLRIMAYGDVIKCCRPIDG